MSQAAKDALRPGTAGTSAEVHGDDVWPVGKKSAYYTCFIAFCLGLSDCLDRQIIVSLFPYLKAEYALTDAQLGSLVSVVNISIAVLVLPSAYFIDRWSRKNMIALMGSVWSLATLACAFAGTFSHLFAARFVCGAGEAGYNPAAQSLLAASFPKRLRTTAAGIAQFGMAIGSPLGLVVGALIAQEWGWRHAFGIVAVPGLILSLMALRIKDFKTVKREKRAADGTPRASYAAVLLKMLRTPSLLCVYLGATLCLLSSMLGMTWMPAYYNRVAHFSVATSSFIAAATMLCGSMVIVLCGPPVDWFRKKRANGGALWLTLALFMATVISIFTFGIATPGGIPQIASIVIKSLFTGTVATVGTAMVMDLTAPNERATAVSLLILFQNILGMGIGPTLGGILSDRFELQTTLLLNVIPLGIAFVLYLVCSFTFTRDMAKVSGVEMKFE